MTQIKITDNYFYYIDVNDNLCVVQGNGNGYHLIAESINKNNIVIDNLRNKIYYLRNETVARGKKNFSLYAMDIEGHGVKKVVFDVSAIKDFDKDSLFIKKNETCAFIVEMPGKPKKNDDDPEITVLDLVRFYKFNKDTCSIELMLTVGMPDVDGDVKTGCFKKSKEPAKFIQLPKIPDYIANPVSFYDDENVDGNAAAKQQERANAQNSCGRGCGAFIVPVNKQESSGGSGCSGCSGSTEKVRSLTNKIIKK